MDVPLKIVSWNSLVYFNNWTERRFIDVTISCNNSSHLNKEHPTPKSPTKVPLLLFIWQNLYCKLEFVAELLLIYGNVKIIDLFKIKYPTTSCRGDKNSLNNVLQGRHTPPSREMMPALALRYNSTPAIHFSPNLHKKVLVVISFKYIYCSFWERTLRTISISLSSFHFWAFCDWVSTSKYSKITILMEELDNVEENFCRKRIYNSGYTSEFD